MKVGDYVRTKDGTLWKPNKIEEIENKWFFDDYYWYDKEYVISSPNIIDLMEEEDLLKIEYFSLRYNKRVTRLFEVTFKNERLISLNNEQCDFILANGKFFERDKELEPVIKSIVTKEQFESMEYKIENQV